MSLSYKQKADLTVTNYVRNHGKVNIPKEITQLILLFYLLKIENEMIFDKDNVGIDIEIISDHKIKFPKITGQRLYMAARLCYGISLDKSVNADIESISWKVKFTTKKENTFWVNCMPFIGVVSNRTTDFDTSPYSGGGQKILKDAYGVGASKGSVYKGKGYFVYDGNYSGFPKRDWVTVKYVVAGSKLIFENLRESYVNDGKYEMTLPNDIDGITEWYPVIALRFPGDGCEIKDIIVR